ncbi:MAG: hypothetical protein BMS9Abin05_2543 [Rhodothermia bacterium]|nr:MAG: hypothetical protein BMS9Abin05_2543 [Rhodothermia bacterium]
MPEKFVDRLNLIVHSLDLTTHFHVARQYLPKLGERPDNLDVDLDRAFAPENA